MLIYGLYTVASAPEKETAVWIVSTLRRPVAMTVDARTRGWCTLVHQPNTMRAGPRRLCALPRQTFFHVSSQFYIRLFPSTRDCATNIGL
ncbi:MAG: hypothetical protein UW82_C0014G0009 [candidate division WWE3 bacterium GW2011_GWC2_44_9]|uniref:Uncharacterized protein n=1 Tax=candidate division WWE3 bacterium GW2011_GWC2_44_9 TaxID=1619125 RepID=A0A0G1MV79_UNCKA|nr:MAG: hypothetical protein UW82_C0014G0009 [candidate division WWE3 bacterium GW2011_GWC2_44_9]